ncbi:lipase class 3 [Ectocarpus siliculosus]|uniref:Lipase class 3 n=1 Tax=Ectocarpus siliculosus TaxID=2880 RepID=D7FY67_ECTSI|nr:lipase class 3 [Ectocarpus siliculosus]|eukprot:CBJ26506.1 lipase class 3 [Ectocarpus siliculosus]
MALGAVASVAAVAALLREAQLPDRFAEWDDELRWEEVHQLAQLSNMTHKDPRLVARWFDCHQYTGALVDRHLPQVSNHYFVHVGHLPGEEHRRVHHVAIRGTVSLADLGIDLKTRQVFDEECGCMFHAGFKEVADAVIEDLEAFLEPGAEVKLAGHSLGGAAAVIVAAKLKLRGHNIVKVMTFGAPMVTDAAGAAVLRDLLPVMRVTHERDPVPLTPLESGSLTSVAAVKLLPKPGNGGGGGGRHGDGDQKNPPTVRQDSAVDEDRVLQSEEEAEGVEEWETAGLEEVGGMAWFEGGVVLEAGVEGGEIADGSRMAAGGGGGSRGGSEESGVGSEETGVGTEDAAGGEGLRVKPSQAYSHFGSQVVLLRRKKCLECFREETAATASTLKRFMSSMSVPVPLGDDRRKGQPCQHNPSRGTTYYDPMGEDGCLFDSPWLRLSHPNYTHRMNHYENEVADRLQHHLLHSGTPRSGSSSSPAVIRTSGISASGGGGGGRIISASSGETSEDVVGRDARPGEVAAGSVRCDAR